MDRVEKISRAWIDRFVIKHNLCPFADKVIVEERVLFEQLSFNQAEHLLSVFHSMIERLLRSDEKEQTGFIIIDKGLEEFDDYLNVLEILESLLEKESLSDEIQLASFHPHYLFEGASENDVENYTNRSPHPMFHLLKIDDVEKAVEAYGDTSTIPKKNIDKLRKLGLEEVLNQIKDIKDSVI